MNEVLSFLTAWLVDLLALGTALLAISALLLVILRPPSARMALARGTLLGLATLCVLTALPFWPRQPLAEVFSQRTSEENAADVMDPLPRREASRLSPLVVEAPFSQEHLVPSAAPPIQTFSAAKLVKFLPLFWLGAAGCAIAYIFVGAWRAFRLLRGAVRAPNWSQQELERLVSPKNRSPRLKTSERIATAAALLAWRPHILLAAKSVSEENKAAVRAALAHEWAHIRHGDLWLLALERLLLPVFCLHPLFWMLRRQVRIDQELLADAAAAGDAPVEYAQALLSWAKAEHAVAAPRWGIAALSLWEHPSNLSRRVEMLLHPQSSASVRGSRLWKWLAPVSLLAAVVGLSLMTLRPTAVAQDEAIADIEIEIRTRPATVKKPKKTKPPKPERETAARPSPELLPLLAPPYEAQIQMQLLIGQVNHAAMAKAESSLGDLIQAAAEDQCRLEGNLIVAELDGDKVNTLTRELKKLGALEILSLPRITTLDEQEASVQVGSQVPVTRTETVNGETRQRIDYQELGELVHIVPRLSGKDSSKLTLEIEAVHTELDKNGMAKSRNDTPRLITHKFKLEVEGTVGKTLLIAERDPKRGSGRTTSILLTVTPQKVLPPPPPAATRAEPRTEPRTDSPEDLSRLRNENTVLRKQVDELQARLVDLEVQIRWLRAAAAPGGEEKVSDEDFLRRVYLDLTGQVPTVEETRAFSKDQGKKKRDKLIDKLLEGEAAKKEASSGWKKWKDALSNDPNAKLAAIKSAPKDAKEDPDSIQVVRLSRSRAEEASQMLSMAFPGVGGLVVAVDERTNALILRGSPEVMQKAKALLEELDREVDPKGNSKERAPQENGASQSDLKAADLRSAAELDQQVWRSLGVKLQVMDEGDFKQLNSRYRGGLKVVDIREGGPASQQGIRSGDVLVGLHLWETLSFKNLAFVLEREESQDKPVDFFMIRGTESLHGQIRLPKREESR